MAADFAAAFAALKAVLVKFSDRLAVRTDTAVEYALVSKTRSPFPQHKGEPLHFGSVRVGKAYVSYHLMPIYMSPDLIKGIPASLKKRMQGKTCFNFNAEPAQELIADLTRLTEAGFREWRGKKFI
jgi:hypothetical protein